MIDRIAGAASASPTSGAAAGASFRTALQAVSSPPRPREVGEMGAPEIQPSGPAEILRQVERAQGRLEGLLKAAESGRTFSPAELLAFQAHTYRASLELDLAGKAVEKGTSAVKQVLQTQL